MAAMPTTVQISEKTKEALLRFSSRLQGRLGRKVTFDEAIAALVARADVSADARERFDSMFGILAGEKGVWHELEDMRKKERSAVERKARSA